MAKLVLYLATALLALLCLHIVPSSSTFAQPRAPHFQYFERPKYRYPYYDENGRGRLLYGYGGPQLYQYTRFTPLDGVH